MKLKVLNKNIFAATGGKDFNAELPTIIFLHGAGMDHTIWNLQTRYFAHHGFSVLAINFPGHGRSAGDCLSSITEMAGWVSELIQAAGLEKATLVGHSMGALVALQCAAEYPERVTSLALLGAACQMPVHPFLLAAAQNDEPIAYDLVTSWGHGTAGHIGRTSVPGMSLIGGGRALLSNSPKGALGLDLAACNDFQNGSDAATKVSCPTLLIIGSDDKMTPAKKGQALASFISNAKSAIIQNCGHMMMLEKSNECLVALKKHIKDQ